MYFLLKISNLIDWIRADVCHLFPMERHICGNFFANKLPSGYRTFMKRSFDILCSPGSKSAYTLFFIRTKFFDLSLALLSFLRIFSLICSYLRSYEKTWIRTIYQIWAWMFLFWRWVHLCTSFRCFYFDFRNIYSPR